MDQKITEILILGPLLCEQEEDEDEIHFLRHKKSSFIIYLDAAVQIKEKLALNIPSVSIGDGDGPQINEEDYRHLLDICTTPEKDESDLRLALNYLHENIITDSENYNVSVHGLWGGRLDHQMAIFGEVARFIQSRDRLQTLPFKFYDQKGALCSVISKGELHLNYQGTFSVFSLLQENQIKISGDVAYQTQSHFSPLSSLGLSNEAKGDIYIASKSPFLLILP